MKDLSCISHQNLDPPAVLLLFSSWPLFKRTPPPCPMHPPHNSVSSRKKFPHDPFRRSSRYSSASRYTKKKRAQNRENGQQIRNFESAPSKNCRTFFRAYQNIRPLIQLGTFADQFNIILFWYQKIRTFAGARELFYFYEVKKMDKIWYGSIKTREKKDVAAPVIARKNPSTVLYRRIFLYAIT